VPRDLGEAVRAVPARRHVVHLLNVVDTHEEAVGADEGSAAPEQPLADWSEHGLGLYLDPRNPEDPRRDEAGRRIWMREAWEWILANEPRAPKPAWASKPALTRFTLSSPKLAGWFAGFDRSVPQAQRVRPAAFGLMGHPSEMAAGLSAALRPARGYESNPEKWLGGPWYDRKTGHPLDVTTVDPGTDPEAFIHATMSGAVRIQTLGDVLARYRLHPEHKSLAPDGRWAAEETRGLLLRRPVESAPVLTDLTGKEANKIIERLTGEITDPREYRVDYGSRADRWETLVIPTLRMMRNDLGADELARRAGVHRRSAERALTLRIRPHVSTRRRYSVAVADWCRERLGEEGVLASRDPLGSVWCYLTLVDPTALPVCAVCGRPLTHRLARYCSKTCRTRAYRARRRARLT
jgi:hypothetical protein